MPSGRASCAIAALAAILLAAPATASAQSGPASSSGGVMFVETPRIGKVACVKRCASRKRLQGGSLARISGRSLGQVTTAIFLGGVGAADDVRVKVTRLTSRRVRARVPAEAASGPIALVTSASVVSRPSAAVAILPPLPAEALSSVDHVFPVAGKHSFGGSNAVFGSGRTGHSHQGHDVFAACGTPLVAARGGRVQARRYHSAGGHYIVIDGDDTDTDYVYMHLAEPSPFAVGDVVATGQRIGSVGDSGNARGCHLHFELWSGPGYYEGGRPFDPLPALRAWRS